MSIDDTPRDARNRPATADPADPVPAADPPATRPDDPAPHGAADEHYPIDKVVFGVAGVLVVAFILWGVLSTESLSAVASAVLAGVITAGGWAFVLAASGFVVFAVYLAASRYGRIPLGRDDEAPEFRTVSWIAKIGRAHV